MTDKIILELTLDELKLIDKYVELNDETESVFDKIKYAYPQPKMTLQQEGEYAVVSYHDKVYYRLMNETTFSWYKRIVVIPSFPTPTLVMVEDAETERLLEGLYYNHIQVKKEKEQRTKTPVEECYKDWWGQYPETGTWDSFDDKRWQGFQAGYEFAYAISTAKEVMEKVQEEQKWDAVRESVKWCEEHPDKDPLDCLKPQTPEQTAQSLKEAFVEAQQTEKWKELQKKIDAPAEGIYDNIDVNKLLEKWEKDPPEFLKFELGQNLTDLIYDWWEDVFGNTDDTETCIDDLVTRIEEWLPKEQSAAGSQSLGVEDMVEGFNDCLKKIKSKLRNKKDT